MRIANRYSDFRIGDYDIELKFHEKINAAKLYKQSVDRIYVLPAFTKIRHHLDIIRREDSGMKTILRIEIAINRVITNCKRFVALTEAFFLSPFNFSSFLIWAHQHIYSVKAVTINTLSGAPSLSKINLILRHLARNMALNFILLTVLFICIWYLSVSYK